MLIIALLIASITSSQGQLCRTLSLEGGGSRGAYEAGAVWALVNNSKPADVMWNIISGVSAGALNTGGLIQYPMGQEVQMAEYLLSVWGSIDNSSQIYVEWKGGLIDGLLFQRGLYNTAPLEELVKKTFINGVHRNFSVGSTNLDTGMFNTFNESVGNAAIDAVISSASIPFMFPPHIFEGHAMADGGCIIDMDVFTAIERCLELTTEPNVVVDMVFDNAGNPLPTETKFKTPEVLMRIYDIMSNDHFIWFTFNAKAAYPKAQFRYIISPNGPLPGGHIPLNFTQPNIQAEIQIGINDTLNVMKNVTSGREIIQELYMKNKGLHFFA